MIIIVIVPILIILIVILFAFYQDTTKYLRKLDNEKIMELEKMKNLVKEKINKISQQNNYSQENISVNINTLPSFNLENEKDRQKNFSKNHINEETKIDKKLIKNSSKIKIKKENLIRGIITKEYINRNSRGRL